MPRKKPTFADLSTEYRETLATRIGLHAEIDGECTLFSRHVSRNGYGRISVKGVLMAAHRFLYQHYLNEALPDHVEVDHLCHNRACVRVAHLEAVDRSTNAKRRRSHGCHHDGTRRSKKHRRT